MLVKTVTLTPYFRGRRILFDDLDAACDAIRRFAALDRPPMEAVTDFIARIREGMSSDKACFLHHGGARGELFSNLYMKLEFDDAIGKVSLAIHDYDETDPDLYNRTLSVIRFMIGGQPPIKYVKLHCEYGASTGSNVDFNVERLLSAIASVRTTKLSKCLTPDGFAEQLFEYVANDGPTLYFADDTDVVIVDAIGGFDCDDQGVPLVRRSGTVLSGQVPSGKLSVTFRVAPTVGDKSSGGTSRQVAERLKLALEQMNY